MACRSGEIKTHILTAAEARLVHDRSLLQRCSYPHSATEPNLRRTSAKEPNSPVESESGAASLRVVGQAQSRTLGSSSRV